MRKFTPTSPAVLGVLCAAALLAQTPTGTIQGTIQDATGALIPSARVVITNVSTNEIKELRSGPTGRYVQPFLLPGTYRIRVEQEGFRPSLRDNIKLDVGQNRSVDFTLEVGAVTQEVQVTAAPPPLDTNTSSIGQVIENKRILDLPLNGRNAFALANLTPGVNPTGGGATPHMGGSRNAISELQIDGVTDIAPENNVGINARVYTPQVDSVEEFSVEVNSLAAEYGRFGGGVINVVTKSGTNEFHGTAYDFLRNSKLDANNFFANRAGRGKGSFKRNQWGGTLGGPIVKDKSFFFFGFEGTNQRNQSIFTGTIPTPEWQQGNFSDLKSSSGSPITIYDPLTVREDPAHAGKFIRDPFPDNRLPTGRLNPVALKALTFYPAPNSAPTNPYTNVNNFTSAGTNVNDSYRTDIRVDQNWTEKWRMFARVSVGWGENVPYNHFGNPGTPSGSGPGNSAQRNVSLDNTLTLSPTLIGNVRYGFGRTRSTRVPFSDGFDLTSLGFPQYLNAAAAREGNEFPRMDFGGVASSLGQSGWTRLFMSPMVHSLSGSMTKILARHTIKVGLEYRKLLINFAQHGYPSSHYTYNRGWTQQEIFTSSSTKGFPLASFLLGLPSGGSMSHDPKPASASSYYGGYIQDDWKLTSKLTLNIGLRYDLDRPRTERFNRYSFFVIDEASPISGKVPAAACSSCGDLRGAMHFVDDSNRRQTPTDKNNFGPRFGFALNATPKLVVRGGYGINYCSTLIATPLSSNGT
jgi:hypothetical protein